MFPVQNVYLFSLINKTCNLTSENKPISDTVGCLFVSLCLFSLWKSFCSCLQLHRWFSQIDFFTVLHLLWYSKNKPRYCLNLLYLQMLRSFLFEALCSPLFLFFHSLLVYYGEGSSNNIFYKNSFIHLSYSFLFFYFF